MGRGVIDHIDYGCSGIISTVPCWVDPQFLVFGETMIGGMIGEPSLYFYSLISLPREQQVNDPFGGDITGFKFLGDPGGNDDDPPGGDFDGDPGSRGDPPGGDFDGKVGDRHDVPPGDIQDGSGSVSQFASYQTGPPIPGM